MATPLDRRISRTAPSARWSPRAVASRAQRRLLATWAVRGYRETNAGHLVSIVAFNALIALVPTLLLVVAVGGLILRDDAALRATAHAILGTMAGGAAGDALEAVITARRYTGWIGALSLVGFLWIGANFADALAHCLNRVHGVPGCGYLCTRRKGFAVVLGAAGLFAVAALAGLPTLVAGWDRELRIGAAGPWGYAVALLAATALFLLLYRVLPNAGQRLGDVWPGALLAGVLFVALGQVFPLYLRLTDGVNRYGAAFGLIWLLVTWFAAIAHVLLFGAYVNATLMRRRRAAAGRVERR